MAGRADFAHNLPSLTMLSLRSIFPSPCERTAMAATPLDLLQGTLDVLILKTLSWEPMHGYGVSRWIAQRTGGTLGVDDAALYQALHRLDRKGWIAAEGGLSDNNRRAKVQR